MRPARSARRPGPASSLARLPPGTARRRRSTTYRRCGSHRRPSPTGRPVTGLAASSRSAGSIRPCPRWAGCSARPATGPHTSASGTWGLSPTARLSTALRSTCPTRAARARAETLLLRGRSAASPRDPPTSTSRTGWRPRPWPGWSLSRTNHSIFNTGSSPCMLPMTPRRASWRSIASGSIRPLPNDPPPMRRWFTRSMTPWGRCSTPSIGWESPIARSWCSPATTAAIATTGYPRRPPMARRLSPHRRATRR